MSVSIIDSNSLLAVHLHSSSVVSDEIICGYVETNKFYSDVPETTN